MAYVKQSYTARPICEFPDAAVESYPEFYAAVARYVERGLKMIDHFRHLREVALMLPAH